MRRHHRFLIGGAMLGFGLLTAVLASTEVRQAKSVKTRAAQSYGSAGLVVSINQETGAFEPPTAPELTAEEMNALSTDSDGLIEVVHPNGAISMDLEGRFQSSTIVVLDAQGMPHISCVDTPQAARAVLGQSVATTPALEEK